MHFGIISRIIQSLVKNKLSKIVLLVLAHLALIASFIFDIKGLMPLFIILSYLIFLFKVIQKWIPKYYKHLEFLTFITSVVLISETILFVLTKSTTSSFSLFNTTLNENGHYVRETNITYTDLSPFSNEFKFSKTTNNYGFTDNEWEIDKPENLVRILCIGDSFTEGIGASSDSSYPKLLETVLKTQYDIEVLKAGRGGSDPFYDFSLLKDKLTAFRPDVVIQSFTANDFYQDFVIRGGTDRIKKDGTDKIRAEYWWTPIYFRSVIFRIIMTTIGGYDRFLIKRKDYPMLYEAMEKESMELFLNYKKLSEEKEFRLILFTFPFQDDFAQNGKSEELHDRFKAQLADLGIIYYNLQPCYEEYIYENESTYKDYYWPIDDHHNAQGYKMMAKCIEEIVEPILLQKIGNEK